MSFWNTLKNLTTVKTEQAGDGLINALAKFDPEGMSEAGMRQLEENVDSMASECAVAKQEWLKEQQEYDSIQKLFDQRIAAADILSTKISAGDTSVEPSLNTLVQLIEDMTPEIEREHEEAVYAKEIFHELELATKDAATQVKTARAEFDKIRRDLKRASVQTDRAKRDEERSKRVAGIRKGGSSLGSAMDAMKNAAAEQTAAADAAKMKADLFRQSTPEKDDPNIAAALVASSGVATSTMTVSERLAALKK